MAVIPILLTLSRFPLAAWMYWLALGDARPLLTVFTIAALTDMIDGWLARRLHAESYLGKRLDSFADYFLIITSTVCLMRRRPEIFAQGLDLWTAIGIALLVPQAIGILRHKRVVGYHLWSTKAASFLTFVIYYWAILMGYSRPVHALLAFAVVLKGVEETLIGLLVRDPYADPRPSILSYRSP